MVELGFPHRSVSVPNSWEAPPTIIRISGHRDSRKSKWLNLASHTDLSQFPTLTWHMGNMTDADAVFSAFCPCPFGYLFFQRCPLFDDVVLACPCSPSSPTALKSSWENSLCHVVVSCYMAIPHPSWLWWAVVPLVSSDSLGPAEMMTWLTNLQVDQNPVCWLDIWAGWTILFLVPFTPGYCFCSELSMKT